MHSKLENIPSYVFLVNTVTYTIPSNNQNNAFSCNVVSRVKQYCTVSIKPKCSKQQKTKHMSRLKWINCMFSYWNQSKISLVQWYRKNGSWQACACTFYLPCLSKCVVCPVIRTININTATLKTIKHSIKKLAVIVDCEHPTNLTWLCHCMVCSILGHCRVLYYHNIIWNDTV